MTISSKAQINWGADPEYFVVKPMTDGRLECFPAAFFEQRGLAPIWKDPSRMHNKYYQDGNGTRVIADGAAFEVGTRPHQTFDGLLANLYDAQEIIAALVKPYMDSDMLVVARPTVEWAWEKWLADIFEEARRFGCDADRDVDNLGQACMTIDATTFPERFGGGHIHWSGSGVCMGDPIQAVRMAKFTFGLTAAAYSTDPVGDRRRSFLYGLPGKFRIQKYTEEVSGVEYRTPSNRWTDPGSPVLGNAMIEASHLLATLAERWEEEFFADMYLEMKEFVNQAIRESNPVMALELLNEVKGQVHRG
jgi:hypothetical protein